MVNLNGPAGSKSLPLGGLQNSDYRHQNKGFFGVYLLIRKRAVLRYIYRLLAVYVSLLAPKGKANIGVL